MDEAFVVGDSWQDDLVAVRCRVAAGLCEWGECEGLEVQTRARESGWDSQCDGYSRRGQAGRAQRRRDDARIEEQERRGRERIQVQAG